MNVKSWRVYPSTPRAAFQKRGGSNFPPSQLHWLGVEVFRDRVLLAPFSIADHHFPSPRRAPEGVNEARLHSRPLTPATFLEVHKIDAIVHVSYNC